MARKNDQKLLAENADLSVRLLEQIVEQSLVCHGFIKRNGTFQLVRRLNKPLTHEEKSYIRRIKRNAVPMPTNTFLEK